MINVHQIVVHWSGIDEGLPVHNGDAVVDPLIDIGDVINVINGHVVVDIRDLNDGHMRVGDVDVLNITRAGVIPGNENFTRREWEPAHSCTNAHRNSPADECNQRG